MIPASNLKIGQGNHTGLGPFSKYFQVPIGRSFDPSYVVEIENGTKMATVYFYDDTGTLLGEENDAGERLYYHPDHLGSTRLVTTQQGVVVDNTEYLPFGLVMDGGKERFLFTGKELETGTSLYYYGARYYDAFLRRFTQPDSIIANPYDPQNLNRYSYVLNNPLKYTDPSGNLIDCAVGCPISGAAIAAWTAASAAITGVMWLGTSIYNHYSLDQPAVVLPHVNTQATAKANTKAQTNEKTEPDEIEVLRGDVSGKHGFLVNGIKGDSTIVKDYPLPVLILLHSYLGSGNSFLISVTDIENPQIAKTYANGKDGKQKGSIYTLILSRKDLIAVPGRPYEWVYNGLLITGDKIIDEDKYPYPKHPTK
ncbi:RHS repeat-associated core domain-containing protein [Candidatus Woesearchaeota archaeon]|nr:RHS repeat-associated core domain-containing protein [Candidatus Woesearchaeota archaeon]